MSINLDCLSYLDYNRRINTTETEIISGKTLFTQTNLLLYGNSCSKDFLSQYSI